MRVLGIIPARGGSKGLPRKNVRSLGGKPLLLWTAEAARGSKRLTRTILTTDDNEISQIGRAAGLDVPFLRPANLATDTTPTVPVLQHAVRALEAAGDHYDAVCLLQPTCPLRTAATIDACIDQLIAHNLDSVVTVLAVPHKYNPHWVYVPTSGGLLELATGEPTIIPRRQDLPPAFHREGSVYVVRRDVLVEQGSLYGARLAGHEMSADESVNIDTEDDWKRAEALLAERS